MEKRIYKHDWRHGHHHHKDQTRHSLLAGLFYALITVAVLASVQHVMLGNRGHHKAPTQWQTYQTSTYKVNYPAEMKVDATVPGEAVFGYPRSKWIFAVSEQKNQEGKTLDQLFADVFEEMQPRQDSEYTRSDMATFNVKLNGERAKILSIRNFGDSGETIIVTAHNDMVYVLRGSTGQRWNTATNDLIKLADTFQFID